MTVTTLEKHKRITGPQRATIAADLKARYTQGASIRDLADSLGRSYGFVHRVLTQAGVELRGRGGSTKGRRNVRVVSEVSRP